MGLGVGSSWGVGLGLGVAASRSSWSKGTGRLCLIEMGSGAGRGRGLSRALGTVRFNSTRLCAQSTKCGCRGPIQRSLRSSTRPSVQRARERDRSVTEGRRPAAQPKPGQGPRVTDVLPVHCGHSTSGIIGKWRAHSCRYIQQSHAARSAGASSKHSAYMYMNICTCS